MGVVAQVGHGGEKAARIGVHGPSEEVADRAGFHDEAAIHDDDAVGDFGDDAEIVGDEDDGHAETLLQVPEQAEDLALFEVDSFVEALFADSGQGR